MKVTRRMRNLTTLRFCKLLDIPKEETLETTLIPRLTWSWLLEVKKKS
jgi:hypothetical protein